MIIWEHIYSSCCVKKSLSALEKVNTPAAATKFRSQTYESFHFKYTVDEKK